jgi:hypothetical protein
MSIGAGSVRLTLEDHVSATYIALLAAAGIIVAGTSLCLTEIDGRWGEASGRGSASRRLVRSAPEQADDIRSTGVAVFEGDQHLIADAVARRRASTAGDGGCPRLFRGGH